MVKVQRPLIIGHRGAPGYRPEHTRASYELACQLGAQMLEPDVVVSRDGQLVVRHENEISSTTDIATRREFAARRTTKIIDGHSHTGWFTEDFSWAELATLGAIERLPKLRPANTRHNGQQGILRLREVLVLAAEQAQAQQRQIGAVIELKHAHYFAARGYDLAELVAAELRTIANSYQQLPIIIESFELGVLKRLRQLAPELQYVFLAERRGFPADEIARAGAQAHDYHWYRSAAGLRYLSEQVHGISIDKATAVLAASYPEGHPGQLIERAKHHNLLVFAWTLRPENRFLSPQWRLPGDKSRWGRWQDEFAQIVAGGVDGIFLDHPDLGVRTLEAMYAA